MPKKTKKSPLQSLLQSSGVTAVAIILLMVSIGAGMVPNIFAATQSPSISNLTATASNNAGYSMSVTWSGYTNDHWKGETLRAGTVVDTWRSNDRKYSIGGLSCGVQYTFRVAAAGPGNGAQSDWKSASATTRCPSAAWVSIGAVGNTVNMNWRDAAGFSQKYTIYISASGGTYNAVASTATTNYAYTGVCNTVYTAKLTATANSQTGAYSDVRLIKTQACPTPPGGGGGGGGGSGSGGSGDSGSGTSGGGTSSGTNTSTSSSGTKKNTSNPAAITQLNALGTPANFSADVVSHKIVALSWDAAANADHYLISRSTDSSSWEEIANTNLTSYKDEGASFSTTYYYQLQAVSANGEKSGALTTQVTTEAFESSSDSITSQDKLVRVSLPDGAIEGEYSCTVSTGDAGAAQSIPKGQSTLLGPYDLLCVTADGDVVGSFEKSVTVNMKLASVTNGYKNITARGLSDGSWTTLKAKYDQQKQEISFTLTSAQSFAAFGEKQHSVWGVILKVFFILLLLGAGVYGYLWWRRRPATPQQAAMVAQQSAEHEFQQALSQPDCTHLSMAQQVIPSSVGCYECEQQHTHWNALRICLLCGHVGCSDDSPQQHALKHYQETGHPLIYEYGNPNGNTIGWCYIDQTYI
jgi:flagellar basal body rod protein FlgG